MWRSVPAIEAKVFALLLAVLVFVASGGHARADEQSGVRDPGSSTGLVGVGDARQASIDSRDPEISDPQLLLNKGVSAYRAGSRPEAQMIFEGLVGRFPQSVEAESARRYLARIYSGLADSHAKVHQVAEQQQTSEGHVSEPSVPVREDAELVPSERLSALMRTSVGDRVFFPQGSTDLGSHARNVLRGQAGWLKQQDANVRALVAGHADEPLDEDGNKILSARRAEAVRARLIEEGIAPERVSVVAVGRSERVADCPGAQCAAQNRRAVTIVLERRADQSGALGGHSYYRPEERDAPASW